jgi:RNA polymerase sigma-70 factor (ECF subfamily)
MGASRDEIEAGIRRLCTSGDWSAAATEALRSYGPEVLGFLHAALGNQADARDAFSLFSESLWRGLPTMRWQSSFRTWAYALARGALGRVHRDPARRGRIVRLSPTLEDELPAGPARTVTHPHQRSEVKAHVRRLRLALDPDDQAILTLRIDREMSWRDIAIVMAGEEAPETDIARQSAALRKRFERLKLRLMGLMQVDGVRAEPHA